MNNEQLEALKKGRIVDQKWVATAKYWQDSRLRENIKRIDEIIRPLIKSKCND